MSISKKARLTKVSKDRQAELKVLCANWTSFAKNSADLSEDEILKAIYLETQDRNREHLLKRMYGRYNAARKAAEMQDLGIA